MKVYGTDNFLRCIKKLERNNSYKNVMADVCRFLSDRSINELHQMKDLINNSPGVYSLNKYRIANSLVNKGKSSSYRCICVCLPKQQALYLDTIYPKTGSLGKENLDKDEYKLIAKNVMSSIEESGLYKIDLATVTFKSLKP